MFQVNDLSQGLRPQHPCPPGALRGWAHECITDILHYLDVCDYYILDPLATIWTFNVHVATSVMFLKKTVLKDAN